MPPLADFPVWAVHISDGILAPAWLVGGLLAVMGVAIVAEQGKGSAFIYFQF